MIQKKYYLIEDKNAFNPKYIIQLYTYSTEKNHLIEDSSASNQIFFDPISSTEAIKK